MSQNAETYLVRCPSCGSANRVSVAMAGAKGKCGSCHADLPVLYTEPLTLGEASFDDFLHNYPGPVLVEFWAGW